MDEGKKLIDVEAAANMLGLKPQTLASWRCTGIGPRYLKVGRLVRYRRDDVNAWLETRVMGSALATE